MHLSLRRKPFIKQKNTVMQESENMRCEHDLLGQRELPADAPVVPLHLAPLCERLEQVDG